MNRFVSLLSALLILGTLLTAALIAQSRPASNLIQNSDFESGSSAWVFVGRGDAKGSMQILKEKPLDPQRPNSMRIEVSELGDLCGIATAADISVRSGAWYDITFAARMENAGSSVGLLFSLETEDGQKVCSRTTLPEIGRVGKIIEGNADNWRLYSVSLHAYAAESKCRLVISPIEPATVWVDSILMNQRAPF